MHSKVKKQNTELRTDRMGNVCSSLCINGVIVQVAGEQRQCVKPSSDILYRCACQLSHMHTVMLAEVADWHPTQKYCVASFGAKPRTCVGEILIFCHSVMYLSGIVLHKCKQNYKTGFVLHLFFF